MTSGIALHVENAFGNISREQWDAVANPGWKVHEQGRLVGSGSAESFNPFVCHDFLTSLEASGCASGKAGWYPRPLLLRNGNGSITAAAPAYLKTHSQGEYVFDHGWADAYERAGGSYYPKVQVSVPFTPATGPRLLVGSGEGADERRAILAAGLIELTRRHDASSAHATFIEAKDACRLEEAGFLLRKDRQFHWTNAGFGSYEDFLGELTSRKRKALRRERRDALADGVEVLWLTGSDLTEAHWDAFHAFYLDTGSRKWGRPYLNRTFFSMVSEKMAERILLVMAKRNGRLIAGALNFIGSDTLYGRHWGAIEEHPFLHFELCYHQAIDYAIAHGLKTVEAGAQGEHKLARGYMPVETCSAHYLADAGLRQAVADYLRREARAVEADVSELRAESPFRHAEDSKAADGS